MFLMRLRLWLTLMLNNSYHRLSDSEIIGFLSVANYAPAYNLLTCVRRLINIMDSYVFRQGLHIIPLVVVMKWTRPRH
jgi:hypothetical protein